MKQNVIDDYNLLSGQQKAAILMLSLNEERSSSLFALMDDEEIKELSVIMASSSIRANKEDERSSFKDSIRMAAFCWPESKL